MFRCCIYLNGCMCMYFMGFVWMTAVMRWNFERFSQFIHINSQKSKTNPNLFPYISIVVLDEMNKVQVCCEALIKEEMYDAYIFMLNSAFEMCPTLKQEEVKCVYGDCNTFKTNKKDYVEILPIALVAHKEKPKFATSN